MTDELNRLVLTFFREKHPTADLAEVTASMGVVTLSMIAASVPANEQEHVYEAWKKHLHAVWPKVRALTVKTAG